MFSKTILVMIFRWWKSTRDRTPSAVCSIKCVRSVSELFHTEAAADARAYVSYSNRHTKDSFTNKCIKCIRVVEKPSPFIDHQIWPQLTIEAFHCHNLSAEYQTWSRQRKRCINLSNSHTNIQRIFLKRVLFKSVQDTAFRWLSAFYFSSVSYNIQLTQYGARVHSNYNNKKWTVI